MFKNYFITAIRNIKREKFFAFMNIAGLALGIGCALVIYKVIDYELSYDKHHSNYGNVYRIVKEVVQSGDVLYFASVPHPLAEALRNDFSNMKSAMTHYVRSGQVTIKEENKLDKKYTEESGVVFIQPEAFNIFDFKFIEGNPETSLVNKGSVVLTFSLAQKYFGLDAKNVHNAMGRTLYFNNDLKVQVTGIIQDTPKNTDIPFTIFFHYVDQELINPYFGKGKNWHSNSSSTNCFVMLPENVNGADISAQFPMFIEKYLGDKVSNSQKFIMQPFSELHSSEKFRNYNEHQVTENMMISLSIIGLFLIITASINFINLTTAQAVKRSKEIGIRKTLGGNKGQLVMQYLGETILISFLASFIGLIISELLMVYLEDIIGYRLNLDMFSNPDSLMFIVGLALIVGLLSGIYPALVMSRMNPVMALKNSLNAKSKSGLLSMRRVLVIIQFTISQVLIIGTIVVSLQIDYFLSKDLGFKKDSIIVASLPDNDPQKLKIFKEELLSNSAINAVSYSLSSPLGTSTSSTDIFHPTLNEDDEYEGNIKVADDDYLELYELKLISGRNYTNADSSTNAVINRKLAKLIGFTNPEEALGQKINSGWDRKFNVIGVVENFHTSGLDESIDYVVLTNIPSVFYEVGVKFNTDNAGISDIKNTIGHVEASFDKVFPEYIFDYEFYDKQIEGNFEEEQNTASLFKLFAMIAIFIGCLGLYGLISYLANQKTKEIGVRKVLGATIYNIVGIFSKEMFYLILIAFALAGPVSYYFMSIWLDGYIYRIVLSPFVFMAAISVSLIIGLLTVGYKSISASLANPVLSLKDE